MIGSLRNNRSRKIDATIQDEPQTPKVSGVRIPRTPVNGGVENHAAPTTAAANPAERVFKLLSRHGIEKAPGRPRERILLWMARVEEALAVPVDAKDEMAIDRMNALRREFFMLEGLMRLYEERYPELHKYWEAFKEIEDTLGAYDFAVAMETAGQAKAGRIPAQFRKPALGWLQEEVTRTRKDVRNLLREHWQPFSEKPLSPRFVHDLMALNWDSDKKDREFLQEALSRTCLAAENKEYDLEEWETGIHELRRQLRWFPICCAALDGAVVLSNKHPVEEYRELLVHPVSKSAYAQLPLSDHERNPLHISRSLFIRNTLAIQEIGELKDVALEYKGLRGALEKGADLKKKEAKDVARMVCGLEKHQLRELKQQADEIYRDLMDKRVLHHFAKELREGA